MLLQCLEKPICTLYWSHYVCHSERLMLAEKLHSFSFVTPSVSEESLSNSYGNVQYSKRSFALLRMTNVL